MTTSVTKYEDPIIKKYIDLVKAKTNVFKAVFQGDPIRIGTSQLPCLIISKLETRVTQTTNVEDEHGVNMRMTIITDIRKELSTNENDAHIVEGIASLYDICEGRDATTYALKDSSILDILRTNQVVDASKNLRTDLTTITRVDYGETLRDREPELWSTEARIDFVAHFIQNR